MTASREHKIHIEAGKVHWAGIEIERADPDTFHALDEYYAIDKKCVYWFDGTTIRGVDRESFAVLGEGWARDSRSLFWNGSRWKDGDPESFQLLYPAAYSSHYVRDKDKVWYDDGYKPRRLRGVKPTEFHVVGPNHGRAGNKLYLGEFLIKGADPDDWRELGCRYYASGDSVYYGHKIVDGASAEAFEPLFPGYGRSNGQYFENGRNCSLDDFRARPLEFNIAAGTVRKAQAIRGKRRMWVEPGVEIIGGETNQAVRALFTVQVDEVLNNGTSQIDEARLSKGDQIMVVDGEFRGELRIADGSKKVCFLDHYPGARPGTGLSEGRYFLSMEFEFGHIPIERLSWLRDLIKEIKE